MTVRELIEKLLALPKEQHDWPVSHWVGTTGMDFEAEVITISREKVWINSDGPTKPSKLVDSVSLQ